MLRRTIHLPAVSPRLTTRAERASLNAMWTIIPKITGHNATTQMGMTIAAVSTPRTSRTRRRRRRESGARRGACAWPEFCGKMRIGAEGGTRTPTGCPTRPSNVRVCQFRHFGECEAKV